ncbi:hypothetical protein [Bacteroides sp. 519]|uniref:hypothetical protein n=1 Tax=Bacteroides sp. 519 TaxID=2302937 RepID=UPI0013D2E13E|nr:hypothetical protein [Bacteroides sp. 519]NDV60733.1 hypothetical protein [Bacteroides sp. 519]
MNRISTTLLIVIATLLYSCTTNKRTLEVHYLKERKLITETIPLDFIDTDGKLNSPYIDTIRFCRLDSMSFTNNHPDRDVQHTTPVALDFSKKIQPYSPEYYSTYTIHYTTKAIEYYNRLFESKIDFDYKPEYRTIEVCFGDFPGITTPDFYIYAERSNPSPSICFHEVGHRAFWYIQDPEKGLGVRFNGLSIVHMGLLEYFTMSLNNSPVVGEDCLPQKMIRDANRPNPYPLDDSLTIRHTLGLMVASYPTEMQNPNSNIAKYLSASYATYSNEIMDKVYDNHRGGMTLASTLWRIRQAIGKEKTDKLVVQTILNLNQYMDERADFYSKDKIDTLPNKIEWCDVFYGLIQQDGELFGGENVSVITKEFEKTGYPIDLIIYQ